MRFLNKKSIKALSFILIVCGLLSFRGSLAQLDVLYMSESYSNYIIFHENYYEKSRSGTILYFPCRYDDNDVYSVVSNNENYYGSFTTETTFLTDSGMIYTIFE